MWETEPNWTDEQLRSIRAQVLVVDGDHDEAIKRAHTEYIAATIPNAGLLILPNTSHFAFFAGSRAFQHGTAAFSRRQVMRLMLPTRCNKQDCARLRPLPNAVQDARSPANT
jgi:hypothetical protein